MAPKPGILIQYHKTPIGELILGQFAGRLCLLDFRYRRMRASIDRRLQTFFAAPYVKVAEDPLLAQVRQALSEYFSGKRQDFTLPLRLAGTPFQVQVWEALRTIPYGKTVSYKALAERVGRPQAVRAVAAANGANAIGIIIPCHRVIASDGSLGGYGGGLRAKKWLLQREGALSDGTADFFDRDR